MFDSLCTAFATAGTGGFGIRNDSFASYSSYLQIVVTVFMLLFSINFSAYYLVFKGKLKDAFNTELRTFLCIVAIAITAITVNVHKAFDSLGEAIRHVSFTVASLISSTGFATVDFDLWPAFSQMLIIIIMFIGACAGSTGGGIKVTRFVILFKSMGKEMKRMLHPRRVQKVTVDSRPLENEVVRSVSTYIIFYIFIFAASLVAISLEGHDFLTDFTAVSTAINNMGPGLSMVGPTQNFGFFSTPSKLLAISSSFSRRLM